MSKRQKRLDEVLREIGAPKPSAGASGEQGAQDKFMGIKNATQALVSGGSTAIAAIRDHDRRARVASAQAEALKAGGTCPRCNSAEITSTKKSSAGGIALMFVGALLCLTIIGALIGLPMMLAALGCDYRVCRCRSCHWSWKLP